MCAQHLDLRLKTKTKPFFIAEANFHLFSMSSYNMIPLQNQKQRLLLGMRMIPRTQKLDISVVNTKTDFRYFF